MIIHSIAAVSLFIGFVSVVWLIVALMLIGIILIQKGKGGGLGGAFGGAGGGGGLLGTKTGDFLTWVTIGLVFLFFFLAILLVKYGKGTAPDGLSAPDL
jgi:preprotein translocase subunit SecG